MENQKFIDYTKTILQDATDNPNEHTISNALGCAMMAVDDFKDREYALKITKYLKEEICSVFIFGEKKPFETILRFHDYCLENKISTNEIEMFWKIILFEAKNMVLDSYFLYLEKKREPRDRFYAPARKQFLKIGVIDALQDMLDDKLDILSISLPPGTKKTTLSKFFISGVIGWFPKDFNLFFSHSADIARMYYDGVNDIISNEEEYCWNDIFPNLSITSTNAKMQNLNVGKYKSFASLQCTSRGSNNAGVVRCSKYLMVDDLVAGIEEALNKATLDKLWNIYTVDARQRKTMGVEDDKPCKEIIIATRWSVNDPIGRLQKAYEGNERCKFIAVPDIDPITGLSNFDYDYNGFTVEFYNDQAKLMDDISYRCLYKNEPVEREGLLYHEDELRRYNSLPLEEPEAIIGVCDVKNKGTDFMFLPCFYKYGEDYYLVDCVCDDNSDYGIQYEKLSNIIVNNNMQQCEFESNSGGDRVSFEVSKRVDEKGGRCNITDKPTETNKETRIIVNADWIKKHVLFRDKSMYNSKDDYGVMMSWLLAYSIVGKNAHDDVPDGLANFVLFVTRKSISKKATAIRNPFWGW